MELGFCSCPVCCGEGPPEPDEGYIDTLVDTAFASFILIYGYAPKWDDPKFVEYRENLPERVEEFLAKMPADLRADLEAIGAIAPQAPPTPNQQEV